MFINILLATIKFKIIYIGYISMRQYWSKSFLQKEQWKQNITDTMIEVYVPWEELLWVWITRSISITWELARNRDSWIPIPNLLNQELREQTRQFVCVCVCVCMCVCVLKNLQVILISPNFERYCPKGMQRNQWPVLLEEETMSSTG